MHRLHMLLPCRAIESLNCRPSWHNPETRFRHFASNSGISRLSWRKSSKRLATFADSAVDLSLPMFTAWESRFSIYEYSKPLSLWRRTKGATVQFATTEYHLGPKDKDIYLTCTGQLKSSQSSSEILRNMQDDLEFAIKSWMEHRIKKGTSCDMRAGTCTKFNSYAGRQRHDRRCSCGCLAEPFKSGGKCPKAGTSS